MAYSALTFTASEVPTLTKWNQLWANDASMNDGTGIGSGVIGQTQLASGTVVQVKSFTTGVMATGTTIMPFDDTIPQITEGNEYMTLSFTPKSATNLLLIQVEGSYSHDATNAQAGMGLFQDAVANALSVSEQYQNTATTVLKNTLRHGMVAGTTSPITFRVRIGSQNAGTLTFNGQSAQRRYGGVINSNISVIEYKP